MRRRSGGGAARSTARTPPFLLLLLLFLLSAGPSGHPAARAERPERTRHLIVGAGALSLDGLPLTDTLSGEVRVEGNALRLDGVFTLAGGAGEATVRRGRDGDLAFTVRCAAAAAPAPLSGYYDIELNGGGAAGSLEATLAAAARGLALVLAARDGSTAAVDLGDGSLEGAARLLAGEAAVAATGSLERGRFFLEAAGPADRFAAECRGRAGIELLDLPLPADGAPALRLGGRLERLALDARLDGPTAECALLLVAPLVALTAEARIGRAGELLGTAEVSAAREALGGPIRFGPFDLLIGDRPRFEIGLSGTIRRPEWRLLRRL